MVEVPAMCCSKHRGKIKTLGVYLFCITGFVNVFLFGASTNLFSAGQPETLDDAVLEIGNMIYNGESKAVIAKRVTTIVDTRIQNINSLERLSNPENLNPFLDSQSDIVFGKWRDEKGAYKQYDTTADWAWENKTGQCGENSALVYYILKKAGAKNVRLFESQKHAYTVWGLHPEADPSDPSMWTNDVIVPDSWFGKVLQGKNAFNNDYVSGGNDVTHERDRFASPRCGLIDSGNKVKSVPACSLPPPCRGKSMLHIGDRCYSCGYKDEPCCPNDVCHGGMICSESKCSRKTEPKQPPEYNCDTLRKAYDQKWALLKKEAADLNCKKKGYSGCATDTEGCRFGMLPRIIFSSKRCSVPGYVACAVSPYENYINCTIECNAAWRDYRQPLGECGTKCLDIAENAIDKGCKNQ